MRAYLMVGWKEATSSFWRRPQTSVRSACCSWSWALTMALPFRRRKRRALHW